MRVLSLVFASLFATSALGLRSAPPPPPPLSLSLGASIGDKGGKRPVIPFSTPFGNNNNDKPDKSNVTYPFEVDVPLKPLDGVKSCTVQQFEHVFANSYGIPYVGKYQPAAASSHCGNPDQWSRVTLEVVGKARGRQYDRIAGIWIGGAEVLRTSTPEPTLAGIEWRITKDISSVLPLLKSTQDIVMELDNVYNSVYNATLNITVSTTFYTSNRQNPPASGSASTPDVVLPISPLTTHPGIAGWYTLSSTAAVDVPVTIPSNAYRAVLEVYASGHGCDEFWYSNPSDNYVTLAKNQSITLCGGGPYREIQAFVDGQLTGAYYPFTTIYTGGIIPTLWRPVNAIHAFNLPPYYLDITPFIGGLVDGKSHNISLSVAGAGSFWLVDANLQIWIDKDSKQTTGGLTEYKIEPQATIKIHEKINNKTLDATIGFTGSRKYAIKGWVQSSKGRVETTVQGAIDFENSQTYLNATNISTWKQRATETHEVSTKTVPVQATLGQDVVDNKHHPHPKPVTTTEVNHSKASSQGRVTYVQFADNSFNITASVGLALSNSINKHGSGDRHYKNFNSNLDETQNGSGYFWASGDNKQTKSTADQETQLKYSDSDRCKYSREVEVSAQKVVADKVNNKCK
ncbi:hypothetical protein BGZ83_006232 [Gryganskiella cystojenkinii]|nr:hypothetical protein BGZ83_006232 [Gryganskiella cystojenkinii]